MLPPLAALPFFNTNVVALISTLSVVVRSISDPLPATLIPSAPSKVNAPALVVKFEAALASSEIALVDAASSVISSAASMSTPAAPSKVNAPALVVKFEAALASSEIPLLDAASIVTSSEASISRVLASKSTA